MSAYRARDSQALERHFAVAPRGIVFFYDDGGLSGARRALQLKPLFKAAHAHGYQCAVIGRAKIGDICARHNIGSAEGAIVYAGGKYDMHVERLDDSVVDTIVRQKLNEPDDPDCARKPQQLPPPPPYRYQKPDAAPARATARTLQKPDAYQSRPLPPAPAPDLSYRLTKKLPPLPPNAHFQKPNEY
ncbi:hypothetical protein H4R21_003260 [Coemansia helicoidea]|uniref:Uncharacterized protein n=2 Tax=Coemansia TaxID=4863 RepID=A0ACC1L4G1_9FUNG|nr:hypothetical protein H4R21_003260 [Coemansia helicoidea]